MARNETGATAGSEVTAQQLERAALELLDRDGVLAGLNLREVADLAGVNRGLVYHYFGSRRSLLRAALRRNAQERRAAALLSEKPARFAARVRQALRGYLRHASTVRLIILLLLDGDAELILMPMRDLTQQQLRADNDAGLLAGDADPVALHAFLQAVGIGYAVTRARLAKEFGVGMRELDSRFTALLERLCSAVDGPRNADG